MQNIESLVAYEKNGWRFEITADNQVRPTTYDRDSTGRPTFTSAKEALETATYTDLSGL